MDPLQKQYEICVPADDIVEAAEKIVEVMNITIDCDRFWKAILIRDYTCEDNFCIFTDPDDKRNFILIDCRRGDSIRGILVRCYGDMCEKVKSRMSEVDAYYRRRDNQEIYEDVENSISDPNDYIHYLMKYYKNLKIPGVNS